MVILYISSDFTPHKNNNFLRNSIIKVYKVGMTYTLAYRCFKICSDWAKFHEELNFSKQVFLKNGYPLSFIDKCFKMVINKLVIKRAQVTTVEKKTLILSLPYLGDFLTNKN